MTFRAEAWETACALDRGDLLRCFWPVNGSERCVLRQCELKSVNACECCRILQVSQGLHASDLNAEGGSAQKKSLTGWPRGIQGLSFRTQIPWVPG